MPHIMKKHLLIIFSSALLCAVMTACQSRAVSTPELYGASVLIRTTPAGVQDTLRVTDSLNVGDTLRLSIVLNGGFNPLKSFTVTADPEAVIPALEADSAVQSVLTDGTNLEKGVMIFQPEKVVVCPVKLRFVPRKSGTHLIQMVIANDAGEGFSPRTYTYYPIVR